MELSRIDTYETGENKRMYFVSIGFGGAGNPVSIDLRNNCQVVTLNHEEEYEAAFMNSSVG
ncbi:hypothetical protein ACFS7Z_26125 [Pontibacter toksunensis]|uniref:Uncharacterized protein n=1 Tax=Pontibacter toksunensis TaxID=1332631 RepID=A0ABW6C265_9BACT